MGFIPNLINNKLVYFLQNEIGDSSKYRGMRLSDGSYRIFSIDNVVISDTEKTIINNQSELQKITSDELILALVNNYRNKNNIQINLDLLKN